MKSQRSLDLYAKSKHLIPGGVNSPVRFFEPHPFFTKHAKGSKIYDVDDNVYIDFCMAYGPLIFGHSFSLIIDAVMQKLKEGTIYGTPTDLELEMAELIISIIPSVEMIRLVNSGTEATMHAIRLARGYTGRKKIIKFEGCYHGAHDYVLVKAGSGAETFGLPTSKGVLQEAVQNTIVLPYNNIDILYETIEKQKNDIAGVIIEPVIGNSGVILPQNHYLEKVRKITQDNDVLLIFDEVITGFRLSLGGAQEYYNIKPDLTTLGKIMGGGFPIAAFGGKKKIMEQVSPLGEIYQAGTFSGNPISVIAGLTTIKTLKNNKSSIYPDLERTGNKIRKELSDHIDDSRISAHINSIASMFQIFFTDKPVKDYISARSSNISVFKSFHKGLLKKGIFLPPSQFETNFISTAHNEDDLSRTVELMSSMLKLLR